MATQFGLDPQFGDLAKDYRIPGFIDKFDISGQQARVGTQDDILGRYRDTIAGFDDPNILRDRFSKQIGLPEQKEQSLRLGEIIGDLTSQYKGADKQVAGTTRESLVTEGQRQGLVQNVQKPLLQGMQDVQGIQSSLNERIASGQELLAQRLGLEFADQDRQLLPFEQEFSAEDRISAAELSGWTTAQNNELNRLVANLNAGVQLNEGEKGRLNALAIAEKGYENALAQIRETGSQNRETDKYSYVDLGQGLSAGFDPSWI